MRVFLDENIPRQLGRLLHRHETSFAEVEGWKGLENGNLLALVEPSFDVMITSDGNIPFQQNLAGKQLSIIVVPTNRLSSLKANAAALRITLEELEAHDQHAIIVIEWSGRRTMRRLGRFAEGPQELTPVSPYSLSGA